jgi:predicted acylesterase/phospholipase RssA
MLSVLRSGLVWTALLLAGCAAPAPRDVVPEKLVDRAQVPHMTAIRTWGDAGAADVRDFLKTEASVLKVKYTERTKKGQPLVTNVLALSGGADDGAFGAGLLGGWSAHGDRPEFDLVTGISAGALIAPFAFLGSDYDRQLAGVFSHGGGEIYQANILGGLFGGSAVADSAPLAALIAKYVDRRMLHRIATARTEGRLLMVGTTNLDAQRPVYWDMGKIAQKGDAQALELFRKILLASASVPGLFPPVNIAVRVGGQTYEEMHVDGGPTRQVFFAPTDFDFRSIDKIVGAKVKRRLWIVRNSKITPEYIAVSGSALAIAERSLQTLTKNQGVGDLIRMYDKAQAEGIEYNLASIPSDFAAPHPAPFDTAYMKTLYERGFALGRAGYPWANAPPGIETTAAR